MKIRIIELLEMIANGQKAPKKIMYDNKLWEYDVQDKDYWTNHYDGTEWLFDEYVIPEILNDEVIILETTITYKSDKIEKIDVAWQNVFDEQAQQDFVKMTLNKINEIIDVINKEN